MPDLLAPGATGSAMRSTSRQRARTDAHLRRSSVWDPLKKIGSWLRREEEEQPPSLKPDTKEVEHADESGRPQTSGEDHGRPSGFLHRRTSKKAVPGLPRPLTFKRMNSEKRDNLLPVPEDAMHRRAASVDRRGSRPAPQRALSPPRVAIPSISAPDVLSPHQSASEQKPGPTIGGAPDSNIPAGAHQVDYSMEDRLDYLSAGEPPPLSIAGDSFYERGSHVSGSDIDEVMLQEELEAKWILNLSMHFRDRSDREKFFITYAEEPNKWRRVTVSCDYRNLTPDSLEADLKSLHYQRDKSARIYEAIRDSLPAIQFYDTVTNLKLETTDGRLHVHVTEDVNEIIPYPSISAIHHLSCKRFKESAVSFDSHISGFVYKVSVNHKLYIKKEIPGPDAVDEFLYEINALSSLQGSNSVIQFEGIIVDEKSEVIKGLLISYAEQGALVDVLYDYRNTEHLPWQRREKWARQIVEGLSEIHEAGFVQGDFTLSNIVIDHEDNAKIIDINRRGCPVGWEPPELARLIESGQRISIYIGVKSDLFQLGMVLWALAEQEDEPERQERPLARSLDRQSSVPTYFREIVKACLSDNPRDRPSAMRLLARFPDLSDRQAGRGDIRYEDPVRRQSDYETLDHSIIIKPDSAGRSGHHRSRSSFSNVHMPSTEYLDSSGSYIIPEHSRRRSHSNRSHSRNPRSDYSPYHGPRSIMSLDDSELENEPASLPASRGTRWEQVYVDGDTKLVQRGGLDIGPGDFEPKDVCITTPPTELCNSFIESRRSDDTPLSMSTVAELRPSLAQQTANLSYTSSDVGQRRQPSNKASFSDRVHNPNRTDNPELTNTLTNLESEIAMDASIASSSGFAAGDIDQSAVFGAPLHQDSGFNEPERVRVSLESERIRQSLEENAADLTIAEEEKCMEGKLRIGTEKNTEVEIEFPALGHFTTPATVAGEEKQRSAVREVRTISEHPEQEQVPTSATCKIGVRQEEPTGNVLDEKHSTATMRPPSLSIPEFHHGVPKPVHGLAAEPTRGGERRISEEERHADAQCSTAHVAPVAATLTSSIQSP